MRLLITVLMTFYITFQNFSQIAPPVFSLSSGIYTEEKVVTLSSTDTTVTILYTLDGSKPSIFNINGYEWTYKNIYPYFPNDPIGEKLRDTVYTYVYSSPIHLKDKNYSRDRYADISTSYHTNQMGRDAWNFDSTTVYKGNVIRAVAFKNGEYSEVVTRNYFINTSLIKDFTLPIVWLTVEPEEFYGYEDGINVPGQMFDEWRTQFPNNMTGNSPVTKANYQLKGRETEVLANFEYYENNKVQINQNIGVRIHGVASRVYPNRSLRLYARKDYGKKYFKYDFFKDTSNVKFKRLVLSNGGQDTQVSLVRDALNGQLAKTFNLPYTDVQPVIVFINGEYNGLYNLRDRFDEKYFNIHYGVEKEELDYIKNLAVKSGSADDFIQLTNYLHTHSLEDAQNYSYIKTRIDIEDFIDYHILQTFSNNNDWPQANNDRWRRKIAYDSTAGYGRDGRWRWLLKDLDHSFGLGRGWWNGTESYYNKLEELCSVSPTDSILNMATLYFRKIIKNEEFVHQFVNRYCDLVNSSLKTSVINQVIDRLKEEIVPEIKDFTERWSPQQKMYFNYYPVESVNSWMENIDRLKVFSEDRPYFARQHLKKQFDGGEFFDVILDVDNKTRGYVKVNSLTINDELPGVNDDIYPWAGLYLENYKIKIKAYALPGYVFSHWSGMLHDTSETLELKLSSDLYIKANFVSEEESKVLSVESKNIQVYPNPSKDNIYVLLENYDASYQLFTIEGKLVKENTLLQPEISIQDIPKGIYLLKVVDNNQRIYQTKIIKE